ncbi:MAG: response regulator transcription factor [Methylococcaceae bacterium]|nr:response regulator transcription factor [Methylococcaceae bacterium]
MNTQPFVFIVDDDDAVRDGLSMVIETVGLACQTFDSAESFLETYKPGTPGCLVLDMNMPGMNGDELQSELISRNIRLPIIFLTAFGDIPTSVRTIKAGAVDFLTKPVQIKQLIDRIQTELQNETLMSKQIKEDQDFHNRINSLTPREMEILPLAIAGLPNKEIAYKLGISYRTVEVHRTQILKKTDTTNFLELARECEIRRVSFGSKREGFHEA